MKFFYVLLSAFVFFCQISHFIHAKRGFKAKLQWEKQTPCEDVKNPKAWLKNVEFVGDLKTESVINADLVVGDFDIPKKIIAVCTVTKCSKIDDKNCEHFIRVEVDFCDILRNRKGQFYSRVLNFQPTLLCPVMRDSTYTVRNGTLDVKSLVAVAGHVPFEYHTYYWNFKVLLKDGDSKPHKGLICFSFMFKVYVFKAQP